MHVRKWASAGSVTAGLTALVIGIVTIVQWMFYIPGATYSSGLQAFVVATMLLTLGVHLGVE